MCVHSHTLMQMQCLSVLTSADQKLWTVCSGRWVHHLWIWLYFMPLLSQSRPVAFINFLTKLGFVLLGQMGLWKTAQALGCWCCGELWHQVERECDVWEVQLHFEILFTYKEIEWEDMFTFVPGDAELLCGRELCDLWPVISLKMNTMPV